MDTVMADRTKVRLSAALASIAVVLSGVALAGCAGSPPARMIRGQPSACGEMATCGQVTDVAGHAVPRARVYLYAWPASWPGRRPVHPGEHVPLQLVGSAVSTSSGHYAVRIAYKAAVVSSAARDGTVNLEVFAGTRAASGAYSFTGRAVTVAGRTALAAANGHGIAHAVAEQANIHLITSGTAGSSASSAVSPSPGFGLACTQITTLVHPEKLEWMKLAASFARSSGVTITYTYTTGQSSSIGVGISPTGNLGMFTASGTYTVSASQSTSFAPVAGPGSVYYETQVEPGLFKTTWSSAFCGSTTWQTQVIGVAGGEQEVPIHKAPPHATRCVFYQSGGSTVLDNSTASTFSVGLSISELGFSASAQTGYDTSGSLAYHFTSSQDVCGLDGNPASANPGPGLVVAGKSI
jgi:hypothetical protein